MDLQAYIARRHGRAENGAGPEGWGSILSGPGMVGCGEGKLQLFHLGMIVLGLTVAGLVVVVAASAERPSTRD